MARFRRDTRAGTNSSPLVDVLPQLSEGMTEEQAAEARATLSVDAEWLPSGPLPAAQLPQPGSGAIVLLASGLVARTTTLEDSVVCDLVGPGGIICPPTPGDQSRLGLQGYTIELTALGTSLIAALGPETLRALADLPHVAAALLRLGERHLADLEAIRAIGQLTGVDRRLLALFELLAARHGRETSEGIAVPVALTHRLLAELVGVRRPTVTTALRQLAETGRLRRLDDGTWLLTHAAGGGQRRWRRPKTTA